MKLPFFERTGAAGASNLPERVTPPWQTLLLVCTHCKAGRRGPDARDIRKGLKQRIGKSKSLRVLESDCLSICPDDAVSVCIVRSRLRSAEQLSESVEVCIVRSHDELERLAEQLG